MRKIQSLVFIVGLGFLAPSVFGVFFPICSAAHWSLSLHHQIAMDQYRTLSLLVAMVGGLICAGAFKQETLKITIVCVICLLLSLIIGRAWSIFTGAITQLLLFETAIEFMALIALCWCWKMLSTR